MKILHGRHRAQLGLIAVLGLAGISSLYAQLDFGKSAEFQTFFDSPQPNLQLPAQVIAEEGKFTLFADFAHKTAAGCPVYLVNRTTQPITLLRADQTLEGLKLTRAADDGRWEKAQSQSYFAGCVSGDSTLTLRAGQHLAVTAYMPATGTPGKVRYQLFQGYAGKISNEGIGFWSPKDVEEAARAEALREQLNAMVNGGPDSADGISTAAGREQLENELAKLDLDSLVTPREALIPRIQALKTRLSKVAPIDPARKRIAELEARHGQTLAPDAFRRLCLEMIGASPSTTKEFGRPENRPWVVWDAINRVSLEPGTISGWKEILQLATSRLTRAGIPEKNAIAGLFRRHAPMAEVIPKSTLIAHINSDAPDLSQACIDQLAYLQDYEELARQGNKAAVPLNSGF